MIVGSRWKLLLLVASCSVLAGGEPVAPPPAQNWVLPLFSDKEGFRTLTARGSNAHQAADKSYGVSDLNITVFSGDAAARDRFQFERLGDFMVDADSKPGKLVLNRSVTLADTWAKIQKKT